ncbi:Werner Syndrome-like [Actinidia chinensis var. chinensis]|uniref:Werner Syndrome-like n=1 Tax=Actinidia chinensis var. chinensis TaxID=1590841 RepID=A0A2R6Q1G8_ACTCC|nr:Werner Syndrome-like [Actinidia chinensis var. chinensis]
MIPLRFLSKMGNYNIRIGGVVIHVRVVDNANLVDQSLSEIRHQIGTNTAVGLIFKSSKMLQICVGSRCLMVLLSHMDISNIPQSLKNFLAEQGICFVGVATSMDRMNMGFYGIECKNIVDVSELAARVLKKPHLYGYGRELKKLAAEVGLQLVEIPSLAQFNWSAKFFSHEEIEYAVHDVCASSLIGTKLLGML